MPIYFGHFPSMFSSRGCVGHHWHVGLWACRPGVYRNGVTKHGQWKIPETWNFNGKIVELDAVFFKKVSCDCRKEIVQYLKRLQTAFVIYLIYVAVFGASHIRGTWNCIISQGSNYQMFVLWLNVFCCDLPWRAPKQIVFFARNIKNLCCLDDFATAFQDPRNTVLSSQMAHTSFLQVPMTSRLRLDTPTQILSCKVG